MNFYETFFMNIPEQYTSNQQTDLKVKIKSKGNNPTLILNQIVQKQTSHTKWMYEMFVFL